LITNFFLRLGNSPSAREFSPTERPSIAAFEPRERLVVEGGTPKPGSPLNPITARQRVLPTQGKLFSRFSGVPIPHSLVAAAANELIRAGRAKN